MNFQRPSRSYGAFEIAPLVDVVFLLLLFFVLSYNVAGESAIRVQLPKSSEADQKISGQIAITIQADGRLFIDDVPYSLPQLIDALKSFGKRHDRQTVTIRADRRLAVSGLVGVVDAVRKAGFFSFSIVTRSPE